MDQIWNVAIYWDFFRTIWTYVRRIKIIISNHFSYCIRVRCSPPFPIGHLRARKPQLIFYAFQPARGLIIIFSVKTKNGETSMFYSNYYNSYSRQWNVGLFFNQYRFSEGSIWKTTHVVAWRDNPFLVNWHQLGPKKKTYDLTYTPPQILPLLRLILSCKKLRQL